MPEKVKVRYQGKEYNINKSYLGDLKDTKEECR